MAKNIDEILESNDSEEIETKINIGDIFFITGSSIRTWSHKNAGEVVNGNKSLSEELFFQQQIRPESDMLFAVRYLGHQVLEEMVTGERIYVAEPSNISDKPADPDFDTYYGGTRDFFDHMYDQGNFYYIQRFKDITEELPLVVYTNNNGVEYIIDSTAYAHLPVNGDTFSLYIQHNDEERREFIADIKEKAKTISQECKNLLDRLYPNTKDIDGVREFAELEDEIHNIKNR